MNVRRIASVLAWLLLGVIAYSTLSPLDLRPHMGSSVQIERFGAFGLTGLMFAIAYPRHVLAVLAAMLAAAIGLELTQMLAADRHARLIDLAVKIAGAGCGVGAGWLLVSLWPGSSRKSRA
ncbi:VanZ family protein [Sinorhizobium meliloti]|uniref:VanZ family protein n=1 Tax=Rhizobium meliloti TaxID=382 RepID=UPI000FD3FED5|nr:VanZ family protein [Sinorhizobium meliloti]MQW54660.1 VanZ family protein [Sinorhizobium meliloti]MQX64688.1 VanZ family protein [Sinorhizobium meliloti]RVI57442.1 VanZ family protein [Sinorhizobium meliloti]RVJ57360.1 VanZ family protein [Sinorhizobium meliloti]RVJ72483.1 VanZ family protein [Sinorhizobium meliloti]